MQKFKIVLKNLIHFILIGVPVFFGTLFCAELNRFVPNGAAQQLKPIFTDGLFKFLTTPNAATVDLFYKYGVYFKLIVYAFAVSFAAVYTFYTRFMLMPKVADGAVAAFSVDQSRQVARFADLKEDFTVLKSKYAYRYLSKYLN